MSCERQTNHTRKCADENTVSASGETETHKALQNDVVLQNIFKYLGYNDLKSCRQVKNCQWLCNSNKWWWSRAKIVFKICEWLWLPEKLTGYLNQTGISSNATNYKFESLAFGAGLILDRVGPSIKILELESGDFSSVDDFRKLLFTRCPNLEKLILGRFSIKNANRPTQSVEPLKWQNPQFGEQGNLKYLKIVASEIPVSWMDLLSHFSNLQALEATVENDDVFKAISVIRQHDPNMLKLSSIKIFTVPGRDYDQRSIRSVLLDRNLSLEGIHINAISCTPDTVLEILDLHAKYLKEVSIRGDEIHQPVLKLPRQPLEILEELSINFCHFPVDTFKYAPNLRKVSCCDNGIDLDRSTVDPNLKLEKCKELTLLPSLYMFGADEKPISDFEFLLNMFPNVEAVEFMELNNLKFSMSCERLTKVVTFSVPYGSKVDVTGLLGFDPDSNAEDGIRKANITNLKDLELFSLESNRSNEWTNRTVTKNGRIILKELESLPHLKKIELRNYQLDGEDQIWKTIFDKYSGQ